MPYVNSINKHGKPKSAIFSPLVMKVVGVLGLLALIIIVKGLYMCYKDCKLDSKLRRRRRSNSDAKNARFVAGIDMT